jgi:hypothetical protein
LRNACSHSSVENCDWWFLVVGLACSYYLVLNTIRWYCVVLISPCLGRHGATYLTLFYFYTWSWHYTSFLHTIEISIFAHCLHFICFYHS